MRTTHSHKQLLQRSMKLWDQTYWNMQRKWDNYIWFTLHSKAILQRSNGIKKKIPWNMNLVVNINVSCKYIITMEVMPQETRTFMLLWKVSHWVASCTLFASKIIEPMSRLRQAISTVNIREVAAFSNITNVQTISYFSQSTITFSYFKNGPSPFSIFITISLFSLSDL